MALSDWLVAGVVGLFFSKELSNAAIAKEQREREHEQYEEERKKREAEDARRDDIAAKRRNTPCKFEDGITYDDFSTIAHNAGKCFTRIKEVTVNGAIVYCTVASQTGYSNWEFCVDFNNWGHLTGTYWKDTDNYDSSIPRRFGSIISAEIHNMLQYKGMHLTDLSDYVDSNMDSLMTSYYCYISKPGFFKRIFSQKKWITSQFDSCDLLGEHLYPVLSMLKASGFKNIKSTPIKDIGQNSILFNFEVGQIMVNGASSFNLGDKFTEDAEVVIAYHAKQEIAIPYPENYFKKKNYVAVGDQLQNMGFSNIYERKIKDLTTGWIKKDGSVEQVLVNVEGEEIPFNKNR